MGKHYLELKLTPSNELFNEHMQEAMAFLYQLAKENIDNYLWYTNWQILLNAKNKSIASAAFKSIPDDEGAVEIGYAINRTYQNNGYMSEAL